MTNATFSFDFIYGVLSGRDSLGPSIMFIIMHHTLDQVALAIIIESPFKLNIFT